MSRQSFLSLIKNQSWMNDELLDDYILAHIDPEPPLLHSLYRATQLHLLYPRMASGHLQGRLLKMLVEMIRPRRILELGTFSGYSAICMAEGMPEGCELHTIEVNDEQEPFTRPWLERSPHADRIHLHIGDALELVPQLGEQFDLVYMDADKRRYDDFYRRIHHRRQHAVGRTRGRPSPSARCADAGHPALQRPGRQR